MHTSDGCRQLIEERDVIGCIGYQAVRAAIQLCSHADGEELQATSRQIVNFFEELLVAVAAIEGFRRPVRGL
jgi:hypothetical protein